MIAAYGLSTPMFHGGFSEVAANEIRIALTTLGPATNDAAGTQRYINNAVNWGHTPKFNAVMTLAKHKLIDLNRKLNKADETMLFEIACNGESNQRGRLFPANEYTSLADRVAAMVRHGAQPNREGPENGLPLGIAYTRNQFEDAVEIGDALKAAGANPLHFLGNGLTMLHDAVGSGNTNLIGTWINLGHPVAPFSDQGKITPAMIAALTDQGDALDMLLTRDRAHIDLINEGNGQTALQFAIENGATSTVLVLLKHRADILSGFGTESTPYKMATRYAILTGDQSMMAMLQASAAARYIPEQLLHH
ncbi:hypothetical protein GCM10022212_35550 [Actimicrobium antarcticum]|uniref:Ankyrin repeat domain-containing protein n=2 Tax=Actimicrobium antarcticum TaxID=1051899 RepID=A0ABP7TYS2_9BURK